MNNLKWGLVDEALAVLHEGQALPQGYIGAIAERIEGVLASEKRMPLEVADSELKRLLLALSGASPSGARAAARGAAPTSELTFAFQLGQVGFAQHLAATAAAKRADDRLVSKIKQRRYERYIRALLEGPLDGVELRQKVGQSKENVSRVLRILRSLGAVDCRKEGARVVNFLTPNAKAVAESLNMSPLPVASSFKDRPADVVDLIKLKTSNLPEKLQSAPNFVAASKSHSFSYRAFAR